MVYSLAPIYRLNTNCFNLLELIKQSYCFFSINQCNTIAMSMLESGNERRFNFINFVIGKKLGSRNRESGAIQVEQ